MLIERDGGNASATRDGLVGVPRIKGSIGGDVNGKGSQSGDGA